MSINDKQKEAFRRNLLRLSPPAEVVAKFDELCYLSNDFGCEDELEDILKDACRLANWAVPWQPEGIALTFRARKLDSSHPEYKEDVGVENSPAEEQSFRRGYSHGFHRANNAVAGIPAAVKVLEPIDKDISQWRSAEFHDRHSLVWGYPTEPNYSCRIRTTSRRSGLPLRTRFAVLERDGRRCVICGASASDGAVLEVDHITPVSMGGMHGLMNLQTLCFDCNRGKADSE